RRRTRTIACNEVSPVNIEGRTTSVIILGINAYHGDAAAAIVRDGELVAAAEEERFNRRKHCAGFPSLSIQYCLKAAGVTIDQVDHIAISRDPSAHLHKKVLYAATRGAKGVVRLSRRGSPASAIATSGTAEASAGAGIENPLVSPEIGAAGLASGSPLDAPPFRGGTDSADLVSGSHENRGPDSSGRGLFRAATERLAHAARVPDLPAYIPRALR